MAFTIKELRSQVDILNEASARLEGRMKYIELRIEHLNELIAELDEEVNQGGD